jgi:K(+)-stimulated pyrophosphate-energized sodium pump
MQKKKSSASVETSAGQAGDIVPEVHEDAVAFLKRKYKTAGIVGVILFILLFFLGWKIAIGFLLGALISVLAGFVGMVVSKKVTAEKKEFIVGLTIASLGLLAVSGYYFFVKDVNALIGLLFGASLISVFGIITKNNGNDKTADIFETYTIAIVGAMILGALLFPRSSEFIYLPLILASVSILASIIASFFKKFKIYATLILVAVAFYPVVSKLMANSAISVLNLYLSALIGLALFVAMLLLSQYPKIKKYLVGLLIAVAVVVNFWLAGIYGVALGVVAMISVAAIVSGTDCAIFSAGLAALALFFVYSEKVSVGGVSQFVLSNPVVIAGLLIGGVLPYLLLTILEKAGGSKKIHWAALLVLLAPILIGFILGAEALGGMLVGAIVVGLFLAISNEDKVAINSLMKGICIVSLLIIGFLM